MSVSGHINSISYMNVYVMCVCLVTKIGLTAVTILVTATPNSVSCYMVFLLMKIGLTAVTILVTATPNSLSSYMVFLLMKIGFRGITAFEFRTH